MFLVIRLVTAETDRVLIITEGDFPVDQMATFYAKIHITLRSTAVLAPPVRRVRRVVCRIIRFHREITVNVCNTLACVACQQMLRFSAVAEWAFLTPGPFVTMRTSVVVCEEEDVCVV